MKTLDAISYALLAMVAIKFVDDVIRAKPTPAAGPAQVESSLSKGSFCPIGESRGPVKRVYA